MPGRILIKVVHQKNSRRSCMSLVAKMEDGNIYPTTAALDPFFRAPVLGKYLEECEEENKGIPETTQTNDLHNNVA